MVQQMGGEGVSQNMGRQRLGDAGLNGVAFHDVPEGLPGHRSPEPAGEHRGRGGAGKQLGAALADEFVQPVRRLLPQWRQPLFVALAHNAHHALAQVELVHLQAHQLGHP